MSDELIETSTKHVFVSGGPLQAGRKASVLLAVYCTCVLNSTGEINANFLYFVFLMMV